ncbi:MAG TPA: hypothetical protein PLA68_01890 [Panacibacter sp.]|nr:hypothetical protein [Panacibacter sp.]
MRFGLYSLFSACFLLCIIACNSNNNAAKQVSGKTDTVEFNSVHNFSKPQSNFEDTLTIRKPSAVFFYPDSLQLIKIKEHSDAAAFASSIHEYYYMMQYAHKVIHNTWPSLIIIEAKKYRYLFFIKKDGTGDCIDLNKNNDTYGLFVFDAKKSPLLIDMTNIETQISFYLKE